MAAVRSPRRAASAMTFEPLTDIIAAPFLPLQRDARIGDGDRALLLAEAAPASARLGEWREVGP